MLELDGRTDGRDACVRLAVIFARLLCALGECEPRACLALPRLAARCRARESCTRRTGASSPGTRLEGSARPHAQCNHCAPHRQRGCHTYSMVRTIGQGVRACRRRGAAARGVGCAGAEAAASVLGGKIWLIGVRSRLCASREMREWVPKAAAACASGGARGTPIEQRLRSC